ncbi:hypothetical protein GGI05_002469, partial [Coemansia sp. RSA 2603]
MPIDPLVPVPIEPTTRCLLLRGRGNDGNVCLDLYAETQGSTTTLPPMFFDHQLPETTSHLMRATRYKPLLSTTHYILFTSDGRSVGRLTGNALGT